MLSSVQCADITLPRIYDLVGTCPEVILELRKEIQQVVADHRGVMTTRALYQMKLLDSVMRESQRELLLLV